MKTERFFIGWSGKTGPELGRFLALTAGALVLGMGLAGFLLGADAGDPAAGLVGLAPPERIAPSPPVPREVEGVLEPGPYPILRLAPTPARPQGEALLLNGFGKGGIAVNPGLYGRRVAVGGVVFARGDIAMLTTDGRFTPLDGPAPPAPVAEPLGRWRIAGELCDGKCYAGVMRPGSGLAHRACAALCFVGEVPLIFVAAEAVGGSVYMVPADADGGMPPETARALIGVPVVLEGSLERRGTLLIFRVDFDRAQLL